MEEFVSAEQKMWGKFLIFTGDSVSKD